MFEMFETAFWKLPGYIFRAGRQTGAKLLSGGFLVSLCGLGAEMLRNCVLDASWASFLCWAPNKAKTAFWMPTLLAGERDSREYA